MSNHWMQTRLFQCPKCLATYLHDRAYMHQLFQCVKRITMKQHTKDSGKDE